MKATYNWLKEFVDIDLPAQQLADRLTMAGLEVVSLEQRGRDTILEIEITSNRPDWLSVIGLAREIAAITNKKIRLPKILPSRGGNKNGYKEFLIDIEDKKDCPLYTAKIIAGVKVGPSPDWLKERLELLGCRSVNNVVDITNFVLFELGEPLHAFDLDRLSPGAIIVRRGHKDEKIMAIDGTPRALGRDILVIADREKAVAVAGVMGGKDTEVTQGTQNVLLEAAVFNPVLIRRGRQTLGMQSESAYRFERGIDLKIVELASFRAVQLIQKIAGGRFVLAKSAGSSRVKKTAINLSTSVAQQVLGINISPAQIKKILNNLTFKVRAKAKGNFLVGVPSYRQDVKLEIDLIEELSRIFGYERIPSSLPAAAAQISSLGNWETVSLIKNILVGLGLNEVITYSLVDKGLIEKFGLTSGSEIEILNPLSQEQEILRPAIMPSLARCLAYNLNQKQDYINIFEIAKTFSGSADLPREELVLAIALCGTKSLLLESGLIKYEAGLRNVKGILEGLFSRLGIKDYNFIAHNDYEVSVNVGQKNIGAIRRLKKPVLDYLDIKNREVFIAEIVLDKLFSCLSLQKKFSPLPKYPAIARDISLLLREGAGIAKILEKMKEKARPLLREVDVVDYYKGKQIPAGFKGLTITCRYRSDERTLTEAEINPLHTLLCTLLTGEFGAKIR